MKTASPSKACSSELLLGNRRALSEELARGAHAGSPRRILSAIRRGADVNGRYQGQTALFWAIGEGHLSAIKTLVRQGAALERKNACGHTPLDQAVSYGDINVVTFLLEAGAKVNAQSTNGSALHMACAYRRVQIAKLLLAKGANPTALDQEGRTPEQLAMMGKRNGRDKTLRQLLKRASNDYLGFKRTYGH